MPDRVDTVIWSGGVANWLLRRLFLAIRLDPIKVGQIILPIGNRRMNTGEHQLVQTLFDGSGVLPTEAQFCREFLVPLLEDAGFKLRLVALETGNGDEICEEIFKIYPELLEGTILSIGNAPSTIQSAGQLRAGARKVDTTFDSNGDQLFMMGDYFPVARHGEDKSTHQNPLSGIGQIPRNAGFLYRAMTG